MGIVGVGRVVRRIEPTIKTVAPRLLWTTNYARDEPREFPGRGCGAQPALARYPGGERKKERGGTSGNDETKRISGRRGKNRERNDGGGEFAEFHKQNYANYSRSRGEIGRKIEFRLG